MSRPSLYHFTCDHGAEAIQADGFIRPMTPWPVNVGDVPTGMAHAPPVAWFTSDPMPSRDAVGLTSVLLDCDRMAYRFQVGPVRAWPWRSFAAMHGCTEEYYRGLVGTYWGRPDTWYVATRPVPVSGWVLAEAVVA